MKKTAIASAIALAATLPLSSVVMSQSDESMDCLLYTSDAADDC